MLSTSSMYQTQSLHFPVKIKDVVDSLVWYLDCLKLMAHDNEVCS